MPTHLIALSVRSSRGRINNVDEEELILGQIDYYRQRAPEYDETSSPPGNPLAPHGQRIEDALDAFAPAGKVLEIASGTGTWTRHLLEHASKLTALDSSPEMHEQSRKKIRDERVRYIERDVFSWEPDDTYDVVFFANWLSHVPPSAFEQFWAIVERALAPEGRVFFVDEVGDAWRNEDLREEFVQGPTVPIVRRPLKDGRTFDVVKVFWEPTELKARLAELGWDINVETSGPFFCAQGHR